MLHVPVLLILYNVSGTYFLNSLVQWHVGGGYSLDDFSKPLRSVYHFCLGLYWKSWISDMQGESTMFLHHV